MKRSWLTLSLAATMLTGCGNMMYGPTPAPVVQQNSFLGPRVPLQNAQTPPQNAAFTQATRQAPPPRQPQYQPPKVSQPHYPPQNTQMQQASPYAQSALPAQRAAQPPQQGNAGWNAQPQPAGNTPPRVYDEPKLPGNNSAAGNTAGTTPGSVTVDPNAGRPTPMRPPERTPATDTAQAARPADSSVPPPVQPVRRDTATQQSAPAETQEVASNKRPPASGGNAGGGAVSSLLRKASDSLGKGDMDGAVGYLENAQRIESNNPKILYDIANIRFHQGRHREADAMASRAVQTAQSSGDKAMEKKAWSLVSKARNELGDRQGALNAANKAAGL